MPSFKTYCWSIGNTSFRVKELSYKNEIQLQSLERLFNENTGAQWGPVLEEKYYDLLTEAGIVEGTAPNKAKDAREISSGLADLGLVNRQNREITEIGKIINSISKNKDYSPNNIFEIDKDCYVYLLQMLKLQVDIEQIHIRPFIALIYMLIHLGYLTREEFTYCLPICKNMDDVRTITDDIKEYRKSKMSINKILLKKMFEMDNYQEAYKTFMDSYTIDENLIAAIGMNRKSASYDKPIAKIYMDLEDLYINKDKYNDDEKIKLLKNLKEDLNKINKNQARPWRQMLGLQKTTKLDNKFIVEFYKHTLLSRNGLDEFKDCFFKIWHLMKWKSTLEDYYDLNKRYFNLTDIIVYSNSKFELTEIANFYFSDIIDKIAEKKLYNQVVYQELYKKYVNIDNIYKECNITTDQIVEKINLAHGINIKPSELNQYVKDKKNEDFLKFVDNRFTNDIILELLDCFKSRNDSRIRELVSEEASASTSFEYILGIIWYNISGRKGPILDYMKLSLDVNLLPKRHAGGGEADLIFKYKKDSSYPAHDLLLEVTLSESTGQRQMEWEPVSRHLENHIKLQSHNENDYVLFIAAILEERTIKAFRTMKFYSFEDDTREYDGLKIIPIDADILKFIILNNKSYDYLYKVFDDSYKSELRNMPWFTETIKNIFI